MKETITIKMQKKAINNPDAMYVIDFEDTVFLSDKYKGVYIKKEKALINLKIIKHMTESKGIPDPRKMIVTDVKLINHLYLASRGRVVRRFDTDSGEHIWIQHKWLEEYWGADKYVTDSTKKLIIPLGRNGDPIGAICKMYNI